MSDYISKSVLIKALKNHPYVFEDFGHIESIGLENVVETINSLPTIGETEIIRKAFERVVEKLEEKRKKSLDLWDGNSRYKGYSKAIEIVKEECGISE